LDDSGPITETLMKRQRFTRWTKAAIPGIIMAGILAGGPSLLAADIPEALDGILISGKGAVVEQTNLDGTAFQSVSWYSSLPYLMWPVDANPPFAIERDPAVVGAWLGRLADDLGYAGFQPKFVERFSWLGNEVWRYALVGGACCCTTGGSWCIGMGRASSASSTTYRA